MVLSFYLAQRRFRERVGPQTSGQDAGATALLAAGACGERVGPQTSGQDAGATALLAAGAGGEGVGATGPLHHPQHLGQGRRLLALRAQDVQDAAGRGQCLLVQDALRRRQVLLGDGHPQRRQPVLKG